MNEQTLSAPSGGELFIFTPLGIIKMSGNNLRKVKFTLPSGMQAFRTDKLDRMKKELTLVQEVTEGDSGRKGLIPTFKLLVPMLDKDGFLVGVASADDATFVLVDGTTLPEAETEESFPPGSEEWEEQAKKEMDPAAYKKEMENVSTPA